MFFDKPTTRNAGGLTWLGGIGLGAGLMYLLDPDNGSRRRGIVRDKTVHASHLLGDALDKGGRDLSHRISGLIARTRGRLNGEEAAGERVVVARVRTELGRVVSHPSSIEVMAHDGKVVLRGPVLAREVDKMVRAVKKVRGVKDVETELEVHDRADHIPGLQGDSPTPRRRNELMQENWAPAVRMVAASGGVALASFGIRKGGVLGALSSIAGGMLALRAFTNLPTKRLTGVGAGHRAIDFHKTIVVHAPLEEVFRFWTHFENFSRFMDHVKEVKVVDDRLSHWKVAGPGGVGVDFDAEITRLEPNRVVAWKTVPSSKVEHAGIIHFEEAVGGGTRLDIQMSYNPPAGAIGHVVASLFRKDPKRAMDEDLVRMKSLLEEGKASAHGERVMLSSLDIGTPSSGGQPGAGQGGPGVLAKGEGRTGEGGFGGAPGGVGEGLADTNRGGSGGNFGGGEFGRS